MGMGRDRLQQTQMHRACAVLNPIAEDPAINPDRRASVALTVEELLPVFFNVEAPGLPAHHRWVE